MEPQHVTLHLSVSSLMLMAMGSAVLAALSTYALFATTERRSRHHAGDDVQPGRHTRPQENQDTGCGGARCPAHAASTQVAPLSHAPELALANGDVKREDPHDPRPRTGYLSWDEYFMSLAFLSAQRSKDPNKQVGAVIVGANKVVLGIGYNGFPRGCPDSSLPWAKLPPKGTLDPLDTKYPYVVHAEANALLNTNTASIQGATVYVTMFPCNECAKLLIQAGVQEVVYHEGKVGEDACPTKCSPTKRTSHLLPDHHYGVALSTPQTTLNHHNHHSNGTTPDVNGSHDDDDGPGSKVERTSSNGSVESVEDGSGPTQAISGAAACYVASKRLLTMAGVKLRQHKLSRVVVLKGP